MRATDEWAELEKLAKAATPGPWSQFNGTDVFTDYPDADGDGWHLADCDVHADEFSNYAPLPTATRTSNAAFIAAANPATILRLINAARSSSTPSGGGDE